jgi:nicotinamide riboside transporter PnuC
MDGTEKAIVIIAGLITLTYLAVLFFLRIDSLLFGTVMAVLGGLAERLIARRQVKRKTR